MEAHIIVTPTTEGELTNRIARIIDTIELNGSKQAIMRINGDRRETVNVYGSKRTTIHMKGGK